MTEERRRECTPEEYILEMFRETKGDELAISYYPMLEDPYTVTYRMDWTKELAEETVQRFTELTASLRRIGELHCEDMEEQECKRLLSEKDFEVWSIYVKPFDAFEYDDSVIDSIIYRMEGDLFPEEEEIWKKYCIWTEEQSQQRLPFNRRSSSFLIYHAMRYEKFVSLGAPEVVIKEEGRSLAEKMVLYYGAEVKPLVWE